MSKKTITSNTFIMKLTFSLLLFFSVFLVSAQNNTEKFRRDFSYVSINIDGEWQPTREVSTTFVFNVNDNGDAVYYSPQGKRHDFKNIKLLESGKTDSGETYQLGLFLDEDGSECYIQLFDNERMGLKLIFSLELFMHFF